MKIGDLMTLKKELFTRENFSKSLDLVSGQWESYEFPDFVTKIRISITSGSVSNDAKVAIAFRELEPSDPEDIENTFMLGSGHNFFIDHHVCKAFSFRTIIGQTSGSKINFEGLKKRSIQNIT